MVTLHCQDGSPDIVLETDADVAELYDALWLVAGRVDGAVTAAAKLQHARHTGGRVVPSDYLDAAENAAVRDAVGRSSAAKERAGP